MRQLITPIPGESLSGYLNRIQSNFKELYEQVDPSETHFNGINANILTSGIIATERIPSDVVRSQEIDGIPDLVLLFENKLI